MNTYTGNTMTTEHFHDFYFMEAMLAGIGMAKSANPELEFKRSFERLESELKSAFEHMAKAMADRIAFYIWAAALGESRYSASMCETTLSITKDATRDFVYKNAHEFPMTTENIETLKSIFSQDWSRGGFGGSAWLNIVESLYLYKSITNAAFIDYTVDLEHNGGNVFDKGTGNGVNWYKNGYNSDTLRDFLNHKFSANILQEDSNSCNCSDCMKNKRNVSGKVYRFLTRYNNVVQEIEAVNFCAGTLEWLTEFSVNWGDGTLELEDSDERFNCSYCGDSVDERDVMFSEYDVPYCPECYDDRFKICEHCQKEISADEAVDVGPSTAYVWVCEPCTKEKGFAQCETCETWTNEFIVTEDDSEVYCTTCSEQNKCDECEEYFSDLRYHKSEEHSQEVEGFEEIEQTVVLKQNNEAPKAINLVTWVIEDSPLFVYNMNDAYKSSNHTYVCYIGGAFLALSPEATKQDVQQAVLRIKDMLDWNQIQSMQDFLKLPEETKDTIKSAWYNRD